MSNHQNHTEVPDVKNYREDEIVSALVRLQLMQGWGWVNVLKGKRELTLDMETWTHNSRT